jgi:type II secretory pathway component PulF
LRREVQRVSASVQAGQPFYEAVAAEGKRFAPVDRQVLAVSEQTGALEVGLFALAGYHQAQASAAGKMLMAALLPALIFVAGVFIANVPKLAAGFLGQSQYGLFQYLREVLGTLALGAAICWALYQLWRVPGWEGFWKKWPLLGRVRFDYALSQWISSVRLMLNAGYGLPQAIDYAGKISASGILRRASEQAGLNIHGQLDVSEALQQTGAFPDEMISLWATGEQSGKLDEMLTRLEAVYLERWQRSLDHLVAWLPRLAYAAVCVFLIAKIAQGLMPIVAAYREALQ